MTDFGIDIDMGIYNKSTLCVVYTFVQLCAKYYNVLLLLLLHYN